MGTITSPTPRTSYVNEIWALFVIELITMRLYKLERNMPHQHPVICIQPRDPTTGVLLCLTTSVCVLMWFTSHTIALSDTTLCIAVQVGEGHLKACLQHLPSFGVPQTCSQKGRERFKVWEREQSFASSLCRGQLSKQDTNLPQKVTRR